MNSIVELSKKTIALTLTIVTIVIIAYSILTKSYSVLFALNINILVIAVLTELLAWFVSALRLRILHRILDGCDKTLSLRDYFYARLMGGLLAYLTPSAIGGEPARAYYLSIKMKSGFSKYFALSIYEVFYDIVIVNTLAIILSIHLLPYTIPVILIGSLSLITWIIIYITLRSTSIKSSKNILISKITSFLIDKLANKFTSINKVYSDFKKSFREITDNIKYGDKIIIILLTLLMYSLNSLTITLISLSIYYNELFLKQYFVSLQALLFALTLGALPTPGGSLAVEYGLSIVLKPGVVVISRTLSYYLVIITGSIILFKTKLFILTTKETN